MAKRFGENPSVDFAASNLMSFGKSFSRMNGQPLDKSEVWYSKNDLIAFAASDSAYVGQKVVFVDVNASKVYQYSIQLDGSLKEIGTVPVGDGATVVVDAEGKISLAGVADLIDTSKTYVPSIVNGKLVWSEPDTSTAEGQAQEIEALKTRATALESKVGSDVDGDKAATGLFKEVDDVAATVTAEATAREEADKAITDKIGEVAENKTVVQMISDALQSAKDYADANDADTIYDDTALTNRVKAIEDDYLKAADKYDDTAVKDRLDVIEADYLKAVDKYDDTALTARVKALEDEERYDDTALQTRVGSLETTVGNHETRISKVEEFFQTADGESLAEAMDTLIEIQKEIAADNEGAAAMLASIEANTEAIEKLNGDSTIEGSVDKKIADAISTQASSDAAKYATQTEVAKKVDQTSYEADKATFALKSDVETSLEGKAAVEHTHEVADVTGLQDVLDNKSEVGHNHEVADITGLQDALDDKSDVGHGHTLADISDYDPSVFATAEHTHEKADINGLSEIESTANEALQVAQSKQAPATTLAGYGITDAYTKAETYAKTETYTKSEIDALLTDIEGGSTESAASVARSLDNYIKQTDTELFGAETVTAWTGADGTYTPDYSQDSRIDTIDTAVKALQSTTNSTDEVVSELDTRVDHLEEVVETATTGLVDKVKALETKDTSLEASITSHSTDITNINNEISNLKSADTTLSGQIGTLSGEVASIKNTITTEDNALKALINSNTTAINKNTEDIAKKANSTDVYTKTEIDTKFTDLDIESIKASINTNTTDIANEIARATAAEQANAKSIADLIGEDSGKTVRGIAAEETAKIVAGADTDYDTLKEIADFIKNDQSGAAAMANDIAALKTTVDTGDKTVSRYVSDAIAAIPAFTLTVATSESLGGIKSAPVVDGEVAANMVSVAADGVATVGKVSISSLVQGEEEILILDGGHA